MIRLVNFVQVALAINYSSPAASFGIDYVFDELQVKTVIVVVQCSYGNNFERCILLHVGGKQPTCI